MLVNPSLISSTTQAGDILCSAAQVPFPLPSVHPLPSVPLLLPSLPSVHLLLPSLPSVLLLLPSLPSLPYVPLLLSFP